MDHYPKLEIVGIACFYCDYRDQSSQTVENILGSLLRQFLTSCASSSVYDSWTSAIESIDRGGRQVALADILSLMKLVLGSLKLAFVCIDALDELEPHIRNQLLVVIQKIAGRNIRVFLTARPHIGEEVNEIITSPEPYKIEIAADLSDIEIFLIHEIQHCRDHQAMNEELQNDIVTTLKKNSNGM